jgi:hypothetical protein
MAALPWLACAAELRYDPATGTVQATGVVSGEIRVFAGDAADVPAMAGATALRNGVLTFTPRYPLVPGVAYRASVGGLSVAFELPRRVGEAARLLRMYPSAAALPANQLKLYLEFSQPMSRGGVWSHIQLVRDDGKVVELPFLEIDQELWSPDQRRLTVLFDPGRIKRGVTPQVEMGEVLEPGRGYTLVVARAMPDANGQSLAEEFRRQFRVAPSLREGIDPKKWKVTASREALTIEFDRPLDWALLQHTLSVKGVAGTGAVDRGETRWRFTPSQAFKAGHYELVIDMSLEDLAGNRIGRPFDVDLFERVTERITAETATLGFDVR